MMLNVHDNHAGTNTIDVGQRQPITLEESIDHQRVGVERDFAKRPTGSAIGSATDN